jgi:hypothetical protein
MGDMRQLSLTLATAAAVALAACTEPPELGVSSAELACHDWGCTGNSPVMGPYRSHEFHTAGVKNTEGLRIDGFWIAGVRHSPAVNGYRLTARLGLIVKAGIQLKGGYFKVIHDSSATEFHIIVKEVSNNVTFWLGDPSDKIPTYELRYRQLPLMTEHALCANPPGTSDPTGAPASPAPWFEPFEAILFAGDRYNASTKQVWAIGGPDVKDWFNVACAGSALAKMHLNRHTTAGAKDAFFASQDARQSLLNAFTANLCGTGVAYTAPNTPLRWKNAAGWKPEFLPAWDLEAVWGPAGAVCIDDAYRVPWVVPANLCAPLLQFCEDLAGYDEDSWQNWGLVRTAIP